MLILNNLMGKTRKKFMFILYPDVDLTTFIVLALTNELGV